MVWAHRTPLLAPMPTRPPPALLLRLLSSSLPSSPAANSPLPTRLSPAQPSSTQLSHALFPCLLDPQLPGPGLLNFPLPAPLPTPPSPALLPCLLNSALPTSPAHLTSNACLPLPIRLSHAYSPAYSTLPCLLTLPTHLPTRLPPACPPAHSTPRLASAYQPATLPVCVAPCAVLVRCACALCLQAVPARCACKTTATDAKAPTHVV